MEKWTKRWDENQLRWHNTQVDPFLVKHLSRLHEQDKAARPGSTPGQFFVPLCGKTLDIAYILSLGFTVFAVEGVAKAVETLSKENGFNLKFYENESIYRSPDGNLEIYLGDLFTCPIEKYGPFDYVWDKGSLTAIDEEMRPSYKAVMQKSVSQEKGFRYLLRTVIYDKSKWDGKGPKCVSEEDMTQLYGDWTSVELLESKPLPDSHVLRKNADIGLVCHENVYLLTQKNV